MALSDYRTGSAPRRTASSSGGLSTFRGAVATAAKPPGKKNWWQKVLSSGPVQVALDTVTRPAYAVGDIISGDPGAALAEMAPFIPPALILQAMGKIERRKILPGQALAKHGLLPSKGVAGFISKFAADVVLDPTTYLTAGIGGVARKSAQAAGSAALKESLATAAKEGRKLTAVERAGIEGKVAAEIAAAPKKLEVGLRVPFSKGKTLRVVSSERAGKAVRAPFAIVGGTRIGKNIQTIIRPGGTANPVVKAIWRGVQEISQRDKHDLTMRLKALEKDSFALDKQLGWKRGQTAEKLSDYFDNPTAHPLDENLSDFAPRVDEVRQDLQQLARESGLLSEKDLIENYLPHLAADRKTAKEVMDKYLGTRDKANPFFTRHRLANMKTLDDWVAAGLKPEKNVFLLLQVRGHQAFDALAKRAADDEVLRQFGGKKALKGRPNVAKTERELADAQAQLDALSAKALGPGGVRTAASEVRRLSSESAASRIIPGAARRDMPMLSASQLPYPLAGAKALNQSLERHTVALNEVNAVAHSVQQLVNARGPASPAATARLGELLGRARERALGQTAGEIGQRTPAVPGAGFMASISGTTRDIAKQGRTTLTGLTVEQSRAYERVFDLAERLRHQLARPGGPSRRELVEAGRRLELARVHAERVMQRATSQFSVLRNRTSAPSVRPRAASAQQRNMAEEFFGPPHVGPLEAAQQQLAIARAQSLTGVSAGTAFQVSSARAKRDALRRKLAKQRKRYEKITAENQRLIDSPAKFTTPEGWQEIRDEWVTLSDDLKGRVPPEIADSLATVMDEMRRSLDGPAVIYEAGHFINRIGSNWKSLAILSPGFHIRNMMDDGLRAWFAGARNPQSYMYSARIVRGGDSLANVKLKIDDRIMSGHQIGTEAEAMGVLDHGIIGYEIRGANELGTSNRYRPSRLGEGTAARGSRKVGVYRENMMRLGTYIDLRRQGLSPLEAAERVKTHHFDYGDVSQLVGRARRFWLPFVTYSSKAVPYFARQLVQRPGQAAGVNKFMIEARDSSGEQIDPSLLAVGQKLSFPIPGVGGKMPILANPENVAYFAALNQFDPTQVQRQFVSRMVNPLVRSPLEVGTQYSFYRGRRAPETVRAPDWMGRLQGLGVPVPGYVPTTADKAYKDVLTKKPIPGIRSSWDALYRNLPVYSQSDLVTGGAAGDWQFGATKFMFGLPITRFDRARAQSLADYFARKNQ